jgi:hypothetical protein
MRELRLGIWVVAVAIAGYGCDNGRGDEDDAGSRRDSGMHTTEDSGQHMVDSGTSHDSGSMHDGGGGGTMCGPTGGACDISEPTSCGAGMACLLTDDGADGVTTACFAAGTGVDGTACDPAATTNACAEGFTCSQSEHVCRHWCCGDADCNTPTPTGQLCNISAGTGPEGHEVGVCVQSDDCDLVAQTGCEAGEECNVFTAGTTICDTPTADAANEGEPCEFRNDCVAGHACIGSGTEFVCRAYCDMSAATPCPDTFACAGLTGAPEGVGVCIPM